MGNIPSGRQEYQPRMLTVPVLRKETADGGEIKNGWIKLLY